jgi:hypothetical protein
MTIGVCKNYPLFVGTILPLQSDISLPLKMLLETIYLPTKDL